MCQQTEPDQLRLKYLDYLHTNLVNVGKILRHQLFVLVILTVFSLYVASIPVHNKVDPDDTYDRVPTTNLVDKNSPLGATHKEYTIPILGLNIPVVIIKAYSPFLVAFAYMLFCLFQFYRDNLRLELTNLLDRPSLQTAYIIPPTIMDILGFSKVTTISQPRKSIFRIASLIMVLIVYIGPVLAQCILVGEALKTKMSNNTVLRIFLCSSFLLPVLGLISITETLQQNFIKCLGQVIRIFVKPVILISCVKIVIVAIPLVLVIRIIMIHRGDTYIVLCYSSFAILLLMLLTDTIRELTKREDDKTRSHHNRK